MARTRRYIVPGQVPVWIGGGRWGPRRVRTHECAAILRAETAYDLAYDSADAAPGRKAVVRWSVFGRDCDIRAELVPNAIWRCGRLFLRCPHCGARATRLYMPRQSSEPRCRMCWGLSYASRSWSYKPTGIFGAILGPVAYATTMTRRDERRLAARARQKARRLGALPR
jgi:hypothetical protein